MNLELWQILPITRVVKMDIWNLLKALWERYGDFCDGLLDQMKKHGERYKKSILYRYWHELWNGKAWTLGKETLMWWRTCVRKNNLPFRQYKHLSLKLWKTHDDWFVMFVVQKHTVRFHQGTVPEFLTFNQAIS